MDFLHFLQPQGHEKFQRLRVKEDFDIIVELEGLVV